MTTEQVLFLAIGAAVVILVIVGVARAATRRRGPNEDAFGAGGVSRVALGTAGVAKTDLEPEGVVLAAGEQWTARSASGARIGEGQALRVVGQDGLTLLVEGDAAGPSTSGPPAPTAPATPS